MKTAIIGLPMVGKTSLFTILTGVHEAGRLGSMQTRIGVAKRENLVDVALLEDSAREDLNRRAPRVLGVLRPLRVVVENFQFLGGRGEGPGASEGPEGPEGGLEEEIPF